METLREYHYYTLSGRGIVPGATITSDRKSARQMLREVRSRGNKAARIQRVNCNPNGTVKGRVYVR